MPKVKVLILFSLIAANFVKDKSPIVKIKQGLVQGQVSENGEFFQYLGIPYATTTSKTRFQAPLPPPHWEGIYQAVNENSRCFQRISKTLLIGEEDCLKLNVYVPSTRKPDELLPVMVYIHGGGFFEGSGLPFLYGPDFLVRQGVVLVTFNYRLNIQGFLCLGIKEAPGNAGLKDQIAALKWVQRNIKAFGGNSDSVTLFGESAGSVSTSYMILSPLAKGLFHRAIMQSGSSLTPFGTQHDPIDLASSLAEQIGFKTKDPYELYNIFMNHTVKDLIVSRVPRAKGNVIMSELLFVPCIEREIPGEDAFITENPFNLLSTGRYNKIPMIIGFNDKEAILFAAMENITTLAEMDVAKTYPTDIYIESEHDKKIIAEKFRQLYFKDKTISKETILNVADLMSDIYFMYPPIIESQLIANTNDEPLYNYIFKYNGKINMPKFISGFYSDIGASHADELFYMFKPAAFPLPQRFMESIMINKVSTMWTNFAKYGDPTPELTDLLPVKWTPSQNLDLNFLFIDKNFSTGPLPISESINLWNETYIKYRRKVFGFQLDKEN